MYTSHSADLLKACCYLQIEKEKTDSSQNEINSSDPKRKKKNPIQLLYNKTITAIPME